MSRMRDLTIDMLAAGGAATRAALHELGHSCAAIHLAVERGEVVAMGRRWVLLPDADPSIGLALALGGVLGGASALRSFGVRVTRPTPLLIVPRPPAGIGAAGAGGGGQGGVELDAQPWRVSLVDALAQHCARVPRKDAIASMGSALQLGLLGDRELDRLLALLSAPRAALHR
jgi:hypothetical protein